MRRWAVMLLFGGLAGCAPGESRESGNTPTFARDVAPLVHGNCSPCHHAGGPGPFSLVTYEEVKKRARQVHEVTQTRFMPPWKPEPGHGVFLDERRLSEAEIDVLRSWHEAGAPAGDLDAAPAPPAFETSWRLGEPDLVLELPRPYAVPAEGYNDFRVFVLPLETSAGVRVDAVEFLTDAPRVLHHILMYLDESGAASEADAEEPGPGFEGMYSARFPDVDELFGWLPGITPRRLPARTAWTLPAGADVILDAHFLPQGKEADVRLRVGFHLAPALRDEEAVPLTLVRVGRGGINIPPGEAEYRVEDSFVLPVPVRVHGIIPHAHFVCRDVVGRALLPDGEVRPLIWIPDWDFNWQDFYRYREPFDLPAGTRVEMVFTYDNSPANSRNPFDPPRRIIVGPGARNEMAVLRLQVTTADEADVQALARSVAAHEQENRETYDLLDGYWTYMVSTFDRDGDATLDPAEEAEATAFVESLREEPERLRQAFDVDRDGALSEEERAAAERVIALWMGARPAGAPGTRPR